MSTVANCPFCHLGGERIVKQNDRAVLFLSNPRLMPGHFLVAPKRHVEKPWELSQQETRDIFELIAFTQQRIIDSKLADGCDVRQNYRPFLPQGRVKIDHVHYHVLPRTLEDELYQRVEKHQTAMFVPLSDDERVRIAKLVS